MSTFVEQDTDKPARQEDDLAETLEETIGQGRRDGQDRRGALERRAVKDRRGSMPTNYCGPERRGQSGRRSSGDRRQVVDRRMGLPGRRAEDRKEFERRIEEGELTLEEIEFVRAVDKYKRKFNRPFPTWSEVLAIVKDLGYVKAPSG
jgi:hypothetical protein